MKKYKIGTYQPRDWNGEYSSWKKKLKFHWRGFWRGFGIIQTIVAVIAAAYFLGMTQNKTFSMSVLEKDNLGPKIEELKNEVLDKLASCESGGAKEAEALIVFDKNSVASLGTWQFQRKTIIHYYRVLYNQDISLKEAALIAFDENKSRELAKKIVFETENGAKEWINCFRTKGLSNDLKLIEKLSK